MILYGEISHRAHCPNCNRMERTIRLQEGDTDVMIAPIWCTGCSSLVKFEETNKSADSEVCLPKKLMRG